MLKQRTFRRGGIHPPDKKHLTSQQPITVCPDPEELIIPFSQHLGAPASPIVSKGDIVQPGQRIAESSGFISAHIHTPLGGEVKEIRRVFLPAGFAVDAAVITVDADAVFEPQETPAEFLKNLSGEELLSRIQEAGVVGMGGAAFPAHVKFKIPKGKQAEYLVINAVECEPYLNADNRIMLEHTEGLLEGIGFIQRMTGAPKVIIGIESNKPEAIEQMGKTIGSMGLEFSLQPLKVKYPQGDEKQLIDAILQREVPSGGLPIDVGAVVTNIGSAYAVFEALRFSKPLFERVVTVSGEAVNKPANIRAKVGTTFRQMIDLAGGFSEEPYKIVAGGPMMGFTVFDLDTPVMKGTSGILALTRAQVQEGVRTACISCGRCVRGCPMGLQPTRLYHLIDRGHYEEAKEAYLLDCKECGCCSYSCPAKIHLVQGMRLGKRMLRNMSS